MIKLYKNEGRIEYYVKKASTTFLNNQAVVWNSDGVIVPATNSSPKIAGLIAQPVSSTDFNYATSGVKVPVQVFSTTDELIIDVISGSASQANVGKYYDLSPTAIGINLSSQTYGQILVTQIISSSKVIGKIVSVADNIFPIVDNTNKLMAVGTRTSAIGFQLLPSYSTLTAGTSRTYHTIPADCDTIVISYTSLLSNYLTPNFLGEYPFDNPFEIKCSVQASNGNILPVFFNNKRLKLVQPGDIVFSDPIAIDIKAGDYISIYTFSNRIISSTHTPASVSSTATGGSTTTLVDSTMNWRTNQWAGYIMNNTTNSTSSVIATNTATTLTLVSTITANANGNAYNITNLAETGNLSSIQRSYAGNMAGLASISGVVNEGAYYSTSDSINPFTYDVTDIGGTSSVMNNNNRILAPFAILGNQKVTDSKAVSIIGDSIAAGSGDYGSPVYSGVDQVGYGFVRTALGLSFPNIQLSAGGEQFAYWGNGTGFGGVALGHQARIRGLMLKYSKFVICTLGTGDIINGATLAQVQVLALKLWNRCVKEGNKVFQCTIMPRSTSTDFWLTTANQTITTSNNFNSIRISFNNWIRAGAPILNGVAVEVGTSGALVAGNTGHPLTNYFEVADAVESSRDSGKWKAPEVTSVTGTATSGSTTTCVDTTKSWETNQWRGYTFRDVTTGAASTISSNTSNTLTLLSAITAVSTSDSYQIFRGIILDGVHPAPFGHALAAAAIDTTLLV